MLCNARFAMMFFKFFAKLRVVKHTFRMSHQRRREMKAVCLGVKLLRESTREMMFCDQHVQQ